MQEIINQPEIDPELPSTVTRRCLKSECPKTFVVAQTSEQRYCCREHDPDIGDKVEKIREAHKRLTAETKARMIAICKEGKDRGWSRSTTPLLSPTFWMRSRPKRKRSLRTCPLLRARFWTLRI